MDDDGTVKKRFRIALDISRPISNRAFTLVEGDTGNELIVTLTDDGVAVPLSDCRVMALFSKSDGTTVSQDSGTENNGVTIGGASGNEITITLFASSFAPGMVECEVQIYSGAALSMLVTSAKFNFRCRRSILNPDTILAVPEYPLLTSLLSEVATLSGSTAAAALAAENALLAAQAGETERNAAEAARTLAETARTDAETARALAETARIAAETARADLELTRTLAEMSRAVDCALLEERLGAAIGGANMLLEELETAVEGLPEFAGVCGILMGDGAGGMRTAVANVDYCEPPIGRANISIQTTEWAADETYASYPYRAAVGVSGALASMTPEVVFTLEDAVSGIFAPVAEAYAGGVYLYASEIPSTTVTIATLTLRKAVTA